MPIRKISMIFIKGEDEVMDKGSGLDAMMSVFIRYAELSAVKYDAKLDIIKVEIALKDEIISEKADCFLKQYYSCMGLYYNLTKVVPIYNKLKLIENSGITILRLYRDSHTLHEEEIELFVGLVRQKFDSLLIRDDNDMVATALSGDAKKNLLDKIRQSHESYHNFFAYRDEGKVFVFNK